ncbi:zinc finger MYM-type protein 5-like [Aphis craccivora]|uniref:Zinc finger MYM-type protein 5-like n=1 Tax=Aphis craccivora TaxID=307492 RepID=A0A6G0Y8X7_APHCR|nr:zinc finger MYM-type protein 5-like [Aphis craccivora]
MDKNNTYRSQLTSHNTGVQICSDDLGTKDTGPRQPVLPVYPLTKFGVQNRAFSLSFYTKFSWIEYSEKNDAVFCFSCRNFSTNTHDDKFDNINGIRNWRKVNFKF